MATLTERIDVKCPHHFLMHHAERYFKVHRRDRTPGTFGLTVDMSKVGLPGKVQARHGIAAATARALLEDVKRFVESDYQMALSTSLAESPKE